MTLRTYKLGPAALKYVERELQKGGPLVSRAKLFAGEVWANLPPNAIEFQQIDNFKEGGVFTAEDAFAISQALTRFVRDFLQASASNLMLAEDRFFGMYDPPNLGNLHLFTYAVVTYHYHNDEIASINDSELEGEINSASSYPQIVLLTTITSEKVLPAREEIAEKFAQELVGNICHVIVGAYDKRGMSSGAKKQKNRSSCEIGEHVDRIESRLNCASTACYFGTIADSASQTLPGICFYR